MPRIKVVVTRNLIKEAQALLDVRSNELEMVQWRSDQPCERSWLLKNVKDAIGLLVMVSERVDAELLDAAGNQFKAIATFSAGVDHIDLDALRNRNIRLGYIAGCLSDAVADLTVMLVLMAQRRGGEAMTKVTKGEWPRMPWHPLLMTGPQLQGATVGFLGFGHIAQAALKRLIAFGIKQAIYVTSRPGMPVREDYFDLIKQSEAGSSIPIKVAGTLDQLASESDVVIVGCALTQSTKHLINDDFLNKMKNTAVIVNIARGPVIDTDALVNALDQGTIFGAGLDVIEDEPNIQADHPILKQPRCVVLPHIGSATYETREQMAIESVQNLLAGLTGKDMVNELKL